MKTHNKFLVSAQEYINLFRGNLELARIISILKKAKSQKIFVIGNGGSAYTASHFAQDLVKVLRLNAESLTDNVGLVTAIANDIDYEDVFKEQLKVKSREGDILIAISCSGNSRNVVVASEYATEAGLKLISFTANNGGNLAQLSSINVNVPTDNIFLAEGIHSLLLHYIISRMYYV